MARTLRRIVVSAASPFLSGPRRQSRFFLPTGPTRWLLSSDSAAVASALLHLAVSLPWDAASIPVVGVGDLLLFGTFYLGLSPQGVRPWASVTILTSGLLVALAVGIARGGAFGIPFMAVGVVLLVAASHRRASSELCPG